MLARHLGILDEPPTGVRYALLAAGVVAVSFSAIFIRLAHAPALAIAFYRNAMTAAVLLPLAWVLHREEVVRLTPRQLGLAVLSGAFLALHFATWIPSLRYTTVAASTVLVTTQPVWVAAAGHLWFGDRLRRAGAVGIAVALAGAAVVSGGDFGLSGRALFGDVLATIGAVMAAGYFLAGRSLRRTVSLVVYTAIVYATCAVLLAGAMAVAGTRFGAYPAKTWGLLALMALVPQVLGHTVFNFLLRHLDPTVISIGIMGEPVGATLLALVFFAEVPPWTAVAGGVVILAGIYVAIAGQARREVGVPVE